jgi:hypothetical protein
MHIRYLAAAVLAFTATASSAAVLVVRSAGPSAKSFPAGKSLDEKAQINLKANDVLVVLDARGTRTLKGPGVFTPGGPAKAAGALSSLSAVAGSSKGRARVGAVRSVGTAPAKPNIWQVDVAKSSNICVTSPSNVTLWRADASKPVTLTVANGSTKASKQLPWAAGQTTLVWPSDLPISDGVDYRLSWDGAKAPTKLQFRTLAAKPTALDDIASTLIRNGCNAQLDLLIETVRLPEDNAAPQG